MSNGELHEGPGTECSICSKLLGEERATQKYGWPEVETTLPPEAGALEVIRDFRPYDTRKLQLQRCTQCGTYYLYRTDYEYLVNGSEDEEFLRRLTGEEAAEYLRRPVPG